MLLFQVSVTLQCRDNPNNPVFFSIIRGGSRTASTSKMEHSVIIVNGCKAVNCYHKELHLGCCSSPRSASDDEVSFRKIAVYQQNFRIH